MSHILLTSDAKAGIGNHFMAIIGDNTRFTVVNSSAIISPILITGSDNWPPYRMRQEAGHSAIMPRLIESVKRSTEFTIRC